MNNLELDVELKIVLPFDNKIINNEKKYQLHSIINDSNQLDINCKCKCCSNYSKSY